MFFYIFNVREKERNRKYNYIKKRETQWRLHLPSTSMRMSKRGKNWRGRFRVDDETIRRWGRVSIGSRGCVLEVTEMDGNKAIAPPTKSEQNRSRCNCCSRGGGIVETIIEPGGTRCAILSGATVLVIASEAITYTEKIRLEAMG